MKLIVVAGPNGSGKTTVIHTRHLDQGDHAILSADSIAKTLENEIPDEEKRNIVAWEKCEEWRDLLMQSEENITWETVFSDERRLDVLRKAREYGYEIELIFVTTRSADINVDRVKDRVAAGGHNVPEEKIRKRYEKTMKLLPDMLSMCNSGYIYDNSLDKVPPFLAITYDQGTILLKKGSPSWARLVFKKMTFNNDYTIANVKEGLIAERGENSKNEEE